MTAATRSVRFLGGLVILLAGLGSSVSAGAASATVTPFGSSAFSDQPTWRPVDFNQYSASADFLSPFAILPAPNHVPHPDLYLGPGAAHAPPYGTEISAGMMAAGITEKSVFSVEEFDGTLGNGIFLAFMVIADLGNAPVGVTPDGMLPMIPNTLFDITVHTAVARNGVLFDHFSFTVPPLDGALNPPFSVAGHSHFPLFIGEDSTFLPAAADLPGAYEFRMVLIDQQGNGFTINTGFVVAVPEPASAVLMVIGALALTGLRRRRQPLPTRQQSGVA